MEQSLALMMSLLLIANELTGFIACGLSGFAFFTSVSSGYALRD